MSAVAATPTTEELIAAFAAALLPFAGTYGVAAASVIPALQQLIANLQATGSTVYTMQDLNNAASLATTDLAQLNADVKAQS